MKTLILILLFAVSTFAQSELRLLMGGGAPNALDILGVTRPVGAGYEMGAYEYNP